MDQQRGRAWRRHQRHKYIRRREHLLHNAPNPIPVLIWQLWIDARPTDVLQKQPVHEPVESLPPDQVVGIDMSVSWWGLRYEDTVEHSTIELPDGRQVPHTWTRRECVFRPPVGSIWRCIRSYLVEPRALMPGQLDKNSNPKDMCYTGKPHGKDKRWNRQYTRRVKLVRARQLGMDYDFHCRKHWRDWDEDG